MLPQRSQALSPFRLLMRRHALYTPLSTARPRVAAQGCPQRIAKRGFYGAFLMDDLPRVKALVEKLAQNLSVPVTCKIRLFPELDKTIAYAKMIEAAGCKLLAVHGRTRDMKDTKAHRADWAAIAAVRAALSIPVIANGDVRSLPEADRCIEATGTTGVLSAEPLLYNPRLFSPDNPVELEQRAPEQPAEVCLEYLALCRQYPTPLRMIRGHVHKFMGGWLSEFTDLRERINKMYTEGEGGVAQLEAIIAECRDRIKASGRHHPVPAKSERQLLREAQEAAKQASMEEQQREAAALAALAARNGGGEAAGAPPPAGAGEPRGPAGGGEDGQPAAKAARLEQATGAPGREQPAAAAGAAGAASAPAAAALAPEPPQQTCA